MIYLRNEMQIFSLHWMMQSINFLMSLRSPKHWMMLKKKVFNVSEAPVASWIGFLPIFQMLPQTFLYIRYHWYSFEKDV